MTELEGGADVRALIARWRERVEQARRRSAERYDSRVPDTEAADWKLAADELDAVLALQRPQQKSAHVCGQQGYCPGPPHYDPICPACGREDASSSRPDPPAPPQGTILDRYRVLIADLVRDWEAVDPGTDVASLYRDLADEVRTAACRAEGHAWVPIPADIAAKHGAFNTRRCTKCGNLFSTVEAIAIEDADLEAKVTTLRANAPHAAPPPPEKYLPALCLDCGLSYADFPMDMLLPRHQWLDIHPDENGLLCARCIVARASKLPGALAVHAVIAIAPVAPPSPTPLEKRELQRGTRERPCFNCGPQLIEQKVLCEFCQTRWAFDASGAMIWIGAAPIPPSPTEPDDK